MVRAANPLIPSGGTLCEAWGLAPVVGHYKCGNCPVCPYTRNTKSFKHHEIDIELRSATNCNTNNVVYCIWCPCGQIYIGQTTQCVSALICEHRNRIRCNVVNAPLVSHYQEKGHTADDITWQVIEKVKPPDRGGDLSALLTRKKMQMDHTLLYH